MVCTVAVVQNSARSDGDDDRSRNGDFGRHSQDGHTQSGPGQEREGTGKLGWRHCTWALPRRCGTRGTGRTLTRSNLACAVPGHCALAWSLGA
jgi:hypothetical protein